MADRNRNPGQRTSQRMWIGVAVVVVIALVIIGVFLSQATPKRGNVASQESAHGPLNPAH